MPKPRNLSRISETRAALREKMPGLLARVDSWAASMGMTTEDWVLRQIETLEQEEDLPDAPGLD